MAIHIHSKQAFLAVVTILLCLLLGSRATAANGPRGPCRATASHQRADDPRRVRQKRRCDGRRRIGGARIARPPSPPIAQPSPPVPAPAGPPPGPSLEPVPEPSPAPGPEPGPEPEEPVLSSLLPGPHALYWGAWIKNSVGEAPWSMTAASKFEQTAGKKVSIINWSSPFYLSNCNGYCTFQTNEFNAVRNHGAIPFFSWNPGPGGGNFTDAKIAAGAQDSYITTWARAAKTWGHPFFLRFAWEMNGSWFPWGVGNNGTTAADYVAMWRHVHDIFEYVGATNVTWVWCPNTDPYNTRTPLGSVYPGRAYVDWTCLDGYNGNNPWTSFGDLFRASYEKITGKIAAWKPMIIGETASTESGGSKAQWIADALRVLPIEFPKVRGVLWFDKVESGPGGHTDWPIESSTTASQAFATAIKASSYAANAYGGISASPIPPP